MPTDLNVTTTTRGPLCWQLPHWCATASAETRNDELPRSLRVGRCGEAGERGDPAEHACSSHSRGRRDPRGRRPRLSSPAVETQAAWSPTTRIRSFLDLTPLGRQEMGGLTAGYPQRSLASGGAATTGTDITVDPVDDCSFWYVKRVLHPCGSKLLNGRSADANRQLQAFWVLIRW